MSRSSIKIDSLAKEVSKALTDYSIDATERTKKSVRKVATDARKNVKAGSPVRKGVYAKSWATKKERETSKDIAFRVYAKKPSYRIAHLLEKGHKSNWGSPVAARVHIKTAEEKAKKDLQETLKKELG